MAELVLSNISKKYGEVPVIKSLDLTVEKGEFITLLGPSGCGKSTTLSMIAGLEAPSQGDIVFQGKTLASASNGQFVEPENREFGVVFQSYALWPHMTVEQNLAFPLKVRKVPQAERKKRIAETLDLVGLGQLGKRYPGQLSGGQQQRVGLARALVYKPSLLLLDEPLSNLDALLREQARVWLKDIQLRLGITTIYVTHDQTEALSLSDRIIVLKDGVVEQNASPTEIYERPTTPFVAEFVGSANFLKGVVSARDSGTLTIDLPEGQTATVKSDIEVGQGSAVLMALRPERLTASPSPDAPHNSLGVELKRNVYVGERFSYECGLGDIAINAFGPHPLPAGATRLYFGQDAVTVFADHARRV